MSMSRKVEDKTSKIHNDSMLSRIDLDQMVSPFQPSIPTQVSFKFMKQTHKVVKKYKENE